MERILSVASFMGKISEHAPGRTCCDYEERAAKLLPTLMEAHVGVDKRLDRR